MTVRFGTSVAFAFVLVAFPFCLYASSGASGPGLLTSVVALLVLMAIAFFVGRWSASAAPAQLSPCPRVLWLGDAAPGEGLEAVGQVSSLAEAVDAWPQSGAELIAVKPDCLAPLLAELERQRDLLILRERNEVMNLLCAGVAHEVANPIGFVTVGTENLQADLEKYREFLGHMLADEDAEVLEAFAGKLEPMVGHLDIILGGCTRIRDITRELQAFARATPGKSRKLIVAHLIENIFGLARTRYKRQAQFVLDGETGLKVLGSAADLNQVFLNLILNAVQAIIRRQEGSADRTPGEVRCTLSHSSEVVRIQVRDDGDGISLDRRDLLFRSGANQRADGTPCMGLHLAQRILEEHGGHLSLGTAERGAVFVIQLPLAPADEA